MCFAKLLVHKWSSKRFPVELAIWKKTKQTRILNCDNFKPGNRYRCCLECKYLFGSTASASRVAPTCHIVCHLCHRWGPTVPTKHNELSIQHSYLRHQNTDPPVIMDADMCPCCQNVPGETHACYLRFGFGCQWFQGSKKEHRWTLLGTFNVPMKFWVWEKEREQ